MEPYDVIVNQPVVIGKKAEETGALEVYFSSEHNVSGFRMENRIIVLNLRLDHSIR
jgi:hypothetical protein